MFSLSCFHLNKMFAIDTFNFDDRFIYKPLLPKLEKMAAKLQLILFIFIAGKDAVKIFSRFEDIFNKIPATFSKKSDHRMLFQTLNLIFAKTRLARFLSPAEISDLEQNIINLSNIIFLKFKKMSITIKMHDVLVHTVRFVRKFKSIGLFNEQSLESLHQVMNIDERKYYHLNKQPMAKTKCIMDQQNIREGIMNHFFLNSLIIIN